MVSTLVLRHVALIGSALGRQTNDRGLDPSGQRQCKDTGQFTRSYLPQSPKSIDFQFRTQY